MIFAVIWIPDFMESDASLAMSRRGEPGGSELHLSEGNGKIFTFPVYPNYSLYENNNKSLVCIQLRVIGEVELTDLNT